MTLKLNLGSYLKRHDITAYRLAAEVKGRIAPNTVYSLARRPAQRIDLKTVGEVLSALERLTGKEVKLTEMLEDQPSPDVAPLRLPAANPTHTPGNPRKFHYSGMGKRIEILGEPSIAQIVSEGRDR